MLKLFFLNPMKATQKYWYSTAELVNTLIDFGFSIYRFENEKLALLPLNYISENCENLFAVRDIESFIKLAWYKIKD